MRNRHLTTTIVDGLLGGWADSLDKSLGEGMTYTSSDCMPRLWSVRDEVNARTGPIDTECDAKLREEKGL